MIAEVGAAVSGIKVAMDMAKGISALKSETEINQAVIDIQRALLDAQAAALNDKQLISQLTDENAALTRQLNTLDAWEGEKTRYVLVQSPNGPVTYDLRPESANGEIPHRLCATCFGVAKKTILQTTAKHSGGELVNCPICKVELTLSNFNSFIGSVRSKRSRYDDLED